MSEILIVEDEQVIRTALKRLLERNGYQVQTAASVKEAQNQYTFSNFSLIISDLRLPGDPGTKLIELAKGVPVLIMTSYSSLKSAVEAIRLGAVDYIAKPFDHDEMLTSISHILESESKILGTTAPSEKILDDIDEGEMGKMIGSSAPMQKLFTKINKVAPTDTTILVLGESGTGKELVARALHEYSRRKDGPMVSVNCAAIPETLIESELFGHEKGAFTGANVRREGLVEAANGGTLFLDEIGELPIEAQARLLRLLQEKEIRRVGSVEAKKVNVRLVAATHRNLRQWVQQGKFREDLYYRLNVVSLELPPLRDRGADILEIANSMLERYCKQMNHKDIYFSDEAILALSSYSWPGNVRELENAVERAVILCENNVITEELLSLEKENIIDDDTFEVSVNPAHKPPPTDPMEDLSLEDYFQRFVLENQDNMTETQLAQKLGGSRKCLWERRQRLGIPRKKVAPLSSPDANPDNTA